MTAKRPFGPPGGHWRSNPQMCGQCLAVAPYWRNFPERAKWWFGKDGTICCPEHIPEWVIAWRLRQRS